jgi:uncharacterized protein YjbI with pentapeptide repeats
MCATASSGLMCPIAGTACFGVLFVAVFGLATFFTEAPLEGTLGVAAFFARVLVAAFLTAWGAFFGAVPLDVAFFGAAFFDATFFDATFFGATFFAATFFAATFFGATFFGATFFGATFFGAAFLDITFFAAAFFAGAFFAEAFFAAGREAVRLTGVRIPVFVPAAVFFGAPLPAAVFLAADFFAADVRVVAMRHHSCGGRCSLARVVT